MTQKNDQAELWLCGPVTGIPPLLQPVAHALLQAKREVGIITERFPDHLLWERPAGLASPAFHLLHLTGVLDRLFTYARGEQLQHSQLQYLREEAIPRPLTTRMLANDFYEQVDKALQQLQHTSEHTLTEIRGVGRKQIPSTVVGLLFHAAEHTQRHVGQLLVTARVLQDGRQS